MSHIKLKRITNAATWYQIFCLLPLTLGMGSIGQSSTFFRTWPCCISNLTESQMQQHGRKYFAIRPTTIPPPTLWMGPKGQNYFFQNIVMLHIKFNGITKSSYMVANILPADPTSSSDLRIKRSKFIFSEHGHVAYQINWNHKMKQHGSKYFAHSSPPPLPLP